MPVVVSTKEELRNHIAASYEKHSLDSKKPSLGFVPTMGALHRGHASLIESSIRDNDLTVVSIFVNPTQFGANEDLSTYPKTLEADLDLCASLGVDIVFTPDSKEIYGEDEITLNPPAAMGYILEGYHRPTHFAGVLQVVLKLFNLLLASNHAYGLRAYFGKKDAQQLLIIQKMVKDFFLPVEIIPCPLVRDIDSLALSSRNAYLSPSQREVALAMPKALLTIEKLIKNENLRDVSTLKAKALEMLEGYSIDYLDFYTRDLKLVELEARDCLLLAAIRIGTVRLLDNIWID